jgi:hypothetical protein
VHGRSQSLRLYDLFLFVKDTDDWFRGPAEREKNFSENIVLVLSIFPQEFAGAG